MTEAGGRRFWDAPSPRVAGLIQQGVRALLDHPADAFAELDEACLAVNGPLVAIEPRFAEAFRAAGRANFTRWAEANLRAPERPVPANLGSENMELARDIVRHGFDETILAGFRAGQNVGIRLWHDLAFQLTSDAQELQELLRTVTRSIFAFVDDTLAGIHEMIRRERDQLADANHVARLETVNLIIEGAPISMQQAGERLRYPLARRHVAGVIWSDSPVEAGALEAVAQKLATAAGAERQLTIPVGSSVLWVWLSIGTPLDVSRLCDIVVPAGTARVALGRPGTDLEGFRGSHWEAVTTQRLVRRLPVRSAVISYEDVEVVALATKDQEKAGDFVSRTLGPLATSHPELRDTLRVFLREQCNLTRTARVLFAHRNTVMSRIERARGLLPEGLDGRTLHVALALEIVHLTGTPANS